MKKLSYQLYSSRNNPPVGDTLKMLKNIGYSQVEGFGGLFGDAAGLRQSLDANGLAMPSGHLSLDALENDFAATLKIAQTLGMETIYCPHLQHAERPLNGAGYADIGQRLDGIQKKLASEGIKFGWHNHDFEFVALADGAVPMAVLFDNAPDLEWEADLAWVAKGGDDPFQWVSDHAARISAVHIKDIAPAGECEDEDGWADVGQGTLDWKSLYAAVAATGCRYFVMEHDNPSDDTRFATRSFEAVQGY
jgi:sugar phosphate isomerase/epimerase